jgi:predicted nucleic acid-binding protein
LKALVLDANILVRAVLGRRVREILTSYAGSAAFFAPDVAYADAERHLPAIFASCGMPAALATTVLEDIAEIVLPGRLRLLWV